MPFEPHHHHNTINNYAHVHYHDPADHDNDGRHSDGAFNDYDSLYGPVHDDHDPGDDNNGGSNDNRAKHNPYDHDTTHHDIDNAFNDDD